VRLHCWTHNTTHHLTPGQAEQVVYALTAATSDAVISDIVPVGEYPCPLEALRWAGDPELYAEHVQQGVESRRAAAR
jgi:hypothetical protein